MALTQALSAFLSLSLSDIIQAWKLNILHVCRFTKSILFKHFWRIAAITRYYFISYFYYDNFI